MSFLNNQRRILIVGILLLVVIIIGSFYSGMLYQRKRDLMLQSSGASGQNMFRDRSGQLPGRMFRSGNWFGSRPMMRIGGNGINQMVSGKILNISGNQITLQAPNGDTRLVTTGSSTTYSKAGQTATPSATPVNLTSGENILITGQVNQDGSITAQNIQTL